MKAAFMGPTPDYALLRLVIAHAQIDPLVPELISTLEEIAGKKFFLETFDPGITIDGEFDPEDSVLRWMRDYQPIFVKTETGLCGWRAISPEPNRSKFCELFDLKIGAASKILPILHENGNLQVAGEKVFLSERVLTDNLRKTARPDLLSHGYRPRKREEVIQILASAFEKEPSQIVILPRMPGELTGHVDLYLLPLEKDRILIPAIEPRALNLVATKIERRLGMAVMQFLNAQASFIEQIGFTVIRVPMFPPMIVPEVEQEEGIDAIFYSPANSILLKMSENEAHVIVPTFDPLGYGSEVEMLVKKYEENWVSTFAAHGYQAHILDATDLGRYLGLFRCVTAIVPA